MKKQLAILLSLFAAAPVAFSMENQKQQTQAPAAAPIVAAQQQAPAVQEPARWKKAIRAILSFPRRAIQTVWHTIWDAPALPEFHYHQQPELPRDVPLRQAPTALSAAEHRLRGITTHVPAATASDVAAKRYYDLLLAYTNQGLTVKAAQEYVQTRTIGVALASGLVAWLIAVCKFVKRDKTMIIGGTSYSLGLIAWLCFRKRAQFAEIARRHKAAVLLATADGVTAEEANQAYDAAIEGVGGRWDAVREFGVEGWHDMHRMRKEVAANYLTLHPEVIAARAARVQAATSEVH